MVRPFAFLAACLVSLPLLAPPLLGSEADGAESAGEVRIGYFGPCDPDHPLAGDMWRAAQLAVDRANADGGYRGRPFRLVPAWSKNPWGTGTAQLARSVYQHRVSAIVGGIDGSSTHLAEQVVAKARLTLISPVSTDRSANLANVPWMFSLAPGNHLVAEPLAEEIEVRGVANDLVLLSADDHDSRMFTSEFRKALKKRNVGLSRQIEFHRSARRSDDLARQVVGMGPALVVISADPGDSARLVGALRAAEYDGLIFGGPAMGHREFVAQAADAAEGVVFPLLYDSRESEFREVYYRKYERQPDYTAAHTYDAVGLLVAAIHRAGPDRERIREALSRLSPWTGATGLVRFDGRGSNTRRVPLGTIREGMVRIVSRTSMGSEECGSTTAIPTE